MRIWRRQNGRMNARRGYLGTTDRIYKYMAHNRADHHKIDPASTEILYFSMEDPAYPMVQNFLEDYDA